jgi:hypothetical protein
VWKPPVGTTVAPPALPKREERKGGIAFDDADDDLAEYMHPDDVPPKRDD